MSLAVLNEGRDIPDDYKKAMDAAWAPARVVTRVAEVEPDKIDALYTALGTRIHAQGEGSKESPSGFDEVIADALNEAGLAAEYAEVAHTNQVDENLREFHNEAIDLVGDEVGTPVIQLGDTAFFGPVITRVPEGEEAGELFDASVRLAQFPYFFELKRSRTEEPQVHAD